MKKSAHLPDKLIDPEFHANGEAQTLWAWMRKCTPIHWHQPSYLPGFWSITCYEDVRAVYSNPQIFSSARGVLLRPLKYGEDPASGITLALTDPPRHKELRSLMSGWFTEKYALSLENAIRRKARVFIKKAVDKEISDFTNDIAARLALYVTCYILGIPDEDQDKVFHWTHEAFEVGKSLATHSQFMLYFGDLMQQRMAKPANDLASAIVSGMPGGKLLAEDEILLNYENLLGATENAGLSMAGGVLTLLQNPDIWHRLCEHRELLPKAVEELLRWSSSATHSMRAVTRATMFKGQQFAEGDRVVLWLPSANRDEKVFTDPFQINITRTPNRHLALGHGRHFCIGNALARIQMRILLTELMGMKWILELVDNPTPTKSIYVSGPAALPVQFSAKARRLPSNVSRDAENFVAR